MLNISSNGNSYLMKYFFCFFLLVVAGCQPSTSEYYNDEAEELSSDFKAYWFDGTAEISSYKLIQSRYGAPREGEAVLIYVTEDFLVNEQVKANQKSEISKTVLKLNRTKNFVTGIYPYSIMNSSFSYLGEKDPLAKISTSVQEWCGQAYMQLNKKNNLSISSHSYFEGEADQKVNLQNALTEDELWHWIRTSPSTLPQGSLLLLPAFEYIRLAHKPLKLYEASAILNVSDQFNRYELNYPELNRKLDIKFEKNFPYEIIGWQEFDTTDSTKTTTSIRIRKMKLLYWKLNHLGEENYRDSLGLK